MSEPHQSRPTSIALGRRTFLRMAGAAAAAGGVEGIVSARRAPAFAQGTKLHVVRWVDFIPEADVELKRQAPEASKALGAEVTFEFINANDLQPRITAAIQSGSGADIIQMLWNWPHLYANGLVDVGRKQLRTTRQRIESEGLRLVAASWRVLDALLVEAQERAGTPEPGHDYLRVRPRLTTEPPAPPAEPVSSHAQPPGGAEEAAALAADSIQLIKEPEFRAWGPAPEAAISSKCVLLNVGVISPRKRQVELLEVARALVNTLGSRDFGVAWQSRQTLRSLTGRDLRYDEAAWLAYLTGPEKPFG